MPMPLEFKFSEQIIDSKNERVYEELESKLNQSVGQQILVVENRIYNDKPSYVRTTLEFGVLTSSLLKNPGPHGVDNITLPMERHAEGVEGQNSWHLVEGPIEINWYNLARLEYEIEETIKEQGCYSGGLAMQFPALHFVFGNEDVEKYFRGKKGMKMNQREFLSPKDIDSYKKALRVFGLDIPLHLHTLQDTLEESARQQEEARQKYG